MNPEDRRYSRDHEWARPEGQGLVRVGITAYAVDELGDVVYFDLVEPGTRLEQSQKLGEVESVKAVSDLFSPVSGEVLEVNGQLTDSPEIVNEDAWERGWLVLVRMSNEKELDDLLTAAEYTAFTSSEQS